MTALTFIAIIISYLLGLAVHYSARTELPRRHFGL
jgi:hypothetical protein